MASLYELLCHHSLTNNDPLLEELLSHLPTQFPSYIFDYIAYEDSDHESVHSIDSFVSAFYSDDSTYVLENFHLTFFIFYATPKFLPQRRAQDIQKGPRPRTTDDPGGPAHPTGPKTRQHRRAPPTAPAFPLPSRRGTAGATADG